jgi:hypothetical protein
MSPTCSPAEVRRDQVGVQLAQQHVRHTTQSHVGRAAMDPRLDVAQPLAAALVQLLDHLGDGEHQ